MVIHELRERLHGLAADILFLQEVHGRAPTATPRGTSTGRRSRSTSSSPTPSGSEVAYGKNAIYRHGHHGNAVLSRFPIVAHENLDISAHAFESRGLLHCVINLGPRVPKLHCLNVHLGLFERGRKWQIRALCERIRDDGPAGRAARHRRRLQRLAAQGEPRARRRARRRRGVRGGARAPGAHLSVGHAGLPPRPHLRARARDHRRARALRVPCGEDLRPRRARRHVRASASAAQRVDDEPVPPGQSRSTFLQERRRYFPSLVCAIDGAEREVWLETYIFADDDAGRIVAARSCAPRSAASPCACSSTAGARGII